MHFEVVLIGTRDRPGGPEDFEDTIEQVRKAVARREPIVTHHAFKVKKIKVPEDHVPIFHTGDDDYPASPSDIEALTKEVELAQIEQRPIVWNHTLRVSFLSVKSSATFLACTNIIALSGPTKP